MTSQNNPIAVNETKRKAALGQKLEDIGWAVLLITVGTIWLIPEKQVPQGSWLIAAGTIMLGLNAIRYFNGIRMSGFSVVAGILAVFAGTGAFFHVNVPLLAIALIAIGICMLFKPVGDDSASAANQGWCCGRGVPQGDLHTSKGQAASR
jgi:hypothetical protein